jgi:cytochrome c biogenesis protein CcdA
MMRVVLLVVTVVFLLGLAFLTVYDVAHNGVTPLDVVSVVIIAFFGVAIVGALSTRPPQDGSTQP